VNTHSVKVFEISTKPFDWHFPAAGVPFLIIGIVLIWIGRRNKWKGIRRWNGYFFVGFSLFWMFTTYRMLSWDSSALQSAYKNGDYSIVEGKVENFRPMPYEGHQEECFSVKAETFCYSDYEPTAGFNNATSHGGPIRAGLPVRIAYIGSRILRIEIRADQVPSLAERDTTKSAAEREWRDREQRNPTLDKMNFGFAIAAVFMTSWWTISWQRFMKFWVKPPNRRATIIGFRIFFLANLIGAIWGLVSQLVHHPRSGAAYLGALKIGGLWIVAIVVMVHVVEWMSRMGNRDELKTYN